jgi:hypothetical protein
MPLAIDANQLTFRPLKKGRCQMSSEKQIEANRANAKKSTGPQTAEGKAHSRANAWKHGLRAETLSTWGEDPDDFEALREALVSEHDPRSQLEFELVERLSGILYRLRRLPFFEAAIIEAREAQLDHEARHEDFRTPYRTPQEFEDEDGSEAEMPAADWSVYVGSALIQDSVYGNTLGKVSRYEAGLMKAFTKTLEVLDELKCRGGGASERPKLEVINSAA